MRRRNTVADNQPVQFCLSSRERNLQRRIRQYRREYAKHNSTLVRSFYGEQKPRIKPSACGLGFYARFLFAIEISNSGTIVYTENGVLQRKFCTFTFLERWHFSRKRKFEPVFKKLCFDHIELCFSLNVSHWCPAGKAKKIEFELQSEAWKQNCCPSTSPDGLVRLLLDLS